MEGGSPHLIWRRWTLPMWYAQLRVWQDFPPVSELFWLYLAAKSKRTPQRRRTPKRAAMPRLDPALLHAPLTDAELAMLRRPARPLRMPQSAAELENFLK